MPTMRRLSDGAARATSPMTISTSSNAVTTGAASRVPVTNTNPSMWRDDRRQRTGDAGGSDRQRLVGGRQRADHSCGGR